MSKDELLIENDFGDKTNVFIFKDESVSIEKDNVGIQLSSVEFNAIIEWYIKWCIKHKYTSS